MLTDPTVMAPCRVVDAGLQLGHAEGLHHIVVGAGTQSGDPVTLLGPGGDRDDGDLAAAAQFSTDFDAVAVGQAEVEQDEVDGRGGERFGSGTGAQQVVPPAA